MKIGKREIKETEIFVIAELGSNHNGDPDLCERMIIEAAACGVDAVKMQKRNNRAMFTKAAYDRPYDNDVSYGKTYGEHREHLDWFGEAEFKRFQAVAKKHGVIFFATPFEEESADFLNNLGVPMFKIASCDASNLPLIKYVTAFGKPILISTGGCTERDLWALKIALKDIPYVPLHCVSTYPNQDGQLNLRAIKTMKAIFGDRPVGFSSHHPGLLPIYLARMMGASLFEVHFTLNRGFRGTDHGFSMEPAGLRKISKDLRRIEVMLGSDEKKVLEAEKGGFIDKMGKGLYLKKAKKAGEIVSKTDVLVKSPAQNGLKPAEIDEIDGKIVINDIATGICLKRGNFDG